jgi:hypothetical protein
MYKLNSIFKALLLSLLFFSIDLKGQEDKTYRFTYSLGSGITLFGLGDVTMVNVENQLNYKASKYFETSLSLQYYTGLTKYDHFASSGMAFNLNGYFLPFTNTRKYALKLGGGLTFLNYNGVGALVGEWINGQFIVDKYNITNFNKLGFNLILENSYAITKRHSIGLKMFIQSYSNYDINSGGIVKLEYQF